MTKSKIIILKLDVNDPLYVQKITALESFDNFKKDFLFQTLSFSQKKDILNSIIKREELKSKEIVSKDFGPKFNDLIDIRNIYAHYPEDVFNDSFYIETSHKQFKSMKELNQKFFNLAISLFKDLEKITNHIANTKIDEVI